MNPSVASTWLYKKMTSKDILSTNVILILVRETWIFSENYFNGFWGKKFDKKYTFEEKGALEVWIIFFFRKKHTF